MNAKLLLPTALTFLASMLSAQTPSPGDQTGQTPAAKLASAVYDWKTLPAIPTPKGARRDVFDGPTTSLDQAHCHITTLNAGQDSGEPRLHLQEEIIIVKEGLVEMHIDGRTQTAGPGSVIFLAARATTRLRNVGPTPCTYIVIYYRTPLTPKA